MAKVDLELVKVVLQRNNLDVRQVATILEEINTELAANVGEKLPTIKKQFVTITTNKDICFVVQIPEADAAVSVRDRLLAAARDYNVSPKGKRLPVKTIGEICEHVPARFLKAHNIWVKTKEPVYLVASANKI